LFVPRLVGVACDSLLFFTAPMCAFAFCICMK
jgi:hypothetical protein